MASGKHIDAVCAAIVVLALLLTVLFMNGEALGIEKINDEDAEGSTEDALFTRNDLDGDWDAASATVITLAGSGGSINGSGAYFYDGNLVIAEAGRYVLSGTLDDGSVSVDAYSSSKVWLLLDNVTVNCSDDACLRVEQADKVFLTLAAGSENRFTASGESYSAPALEDGTGGAIFTHDDLTINGSGSLAITAQYKHGIDANDALVITGGTISITCPQDGLHVNDSFRFREADLTISAGDDGIHSDTSIYVESGTVLLSSCYEGLEAPEIEIAGGDVAIYPTDDGINANGGSGGFGAFGGFGRGDQSADTGSAEAAGSDGGGETEESCFRMSGGTLTIVNENARDADGIDSNGSIYISGGSIRVSMADNGGYTLDVGSESGGVMEISGGDLVGCGSYTMAESFDASSTQPSILYVYSDGAEAGTAVALEDTEGNVLISYTAPCAFSCVNLSCPELTVGGTYVVVIGDNEEEITLEDVSASFGDAQSGGFFGPMQFGGMRSRDSQDGETAQDGQDGQWSRGGQGNRGGRRGQGAFTAGAEESFRPSDDGEGESFPFPDFAEGELPQPPDFDSEGTSFPPEFDGENMPAPPEFDGEEMPMPSFFGGDSGFGAAFGDGDMRRPMDFGGTQEDGSGAAAADTAEYGAEVWISAGVSLAVLLLGIVFAAAFRRRGRI